MKNRHWQRRGVSDAPATAITPGGCVLCVATAATALLVGCYTASPVADMHALSAGHSVVLHLNDSGRASMGELIGPEVRAVEGSVVRADASEVTVGVRVITYINGSRAMWNGEQITLQRQHLGLASRQQLSRSRSAVLAAVGAVALAAVVTRAGLYGSGNDLPRDRDGGDKPDS